MECQKLIKIFVLVSFLAAVLGCSYPISQQLRQEARKDLTFPTVLKNPTNYIGSIVLWGGSIIETVTLSEGSEIFVLQTPLDYVEVPEGSRYSQGRFIAKSSSFLDPEIYKNGRRITLAAEITGKETRPLGKSKYIYPVVAIKELHLWKQRKASVHPYPYHGWYYVPEWGPDLDWYGTGPYRNHRDDREEEEEEEN
jgi:outer membrane lipoprotein